MKYRNQISFKLYGKNALFTDPITGVGGEKFSYQIPTYEALKGVVKGIYWKPTIKWTIDRCRVIKIIQTQSKSVRSIKYQKAGNDLCFYTYLSDVEYQVEAHFEWNEFRQDLIQDRNEDKHYQIAKRMVERGGRRDIFLGTRECYAYVEPCVFGEGISVYDDVEELTFGNMFHSFSYADENEEHQFKVRFWSPIMKHGIIEFINPDDCIEKIIRSEEPKVYVPNVNFNEYSAWDDEEVIT